MTPLPAPLGKGPLTFWRLDQKLYASTWDSGLGAHRYGGRWNSKGVSAVYCSVDPATALLEVAVHKGFRALDVVPHVLTAFTVSDPTRVRVLLPAEVPNPNWLAPGTPSAGQQQFGDALLQGDDFILLPSAVSRASWNMIFDPNRAGPEAYALLTQTDFALDGRLHPPVP
jgi:RES domain-containing protein